MIFGVVYVTSVMFNGVLLYSQMRTTQQAGVGCVSARLLHLMLQTLLLAPCLRCSASCPIWTRYTKHLSRIKL